MLKITALIIAFGSQILHFTQDMNAKFGNMKVAFEKLLKADCDTPDPGDQDGFE